MEVDSRPYSEHQTRNLKIDVLLNEQGWTVSNRPQIIEEVDTGQSYFITHMYRTFEETYGNCIESRYGEYLLFDSYGAAFTIIEVY